MGKDRRKSIDSSDSDSSNSDHSSKGKKHKEKKDKKGAQFVAQGSPSAHGFHSPPFAPPSFDENRGHAPPSFPAPGGPPSGHELNRDHSGAPAFPGHHQAPPPGYDHNVPPSGYRLPLRTDAAFPEPHKTGQPPCYEPDGVTPIYIGSAIFEKSVHPCKIGRHLSPFASVPYGGSELGHHGRFDLLPFDPNMMEWVRTSGGRVPPGRRPVEGGYEESGQKLYHGLAVINGAKVPGKAGEHLNGCSVGFGGQEYGLPDHEMLCWRF